MQDAEDAYLAYHAPSWLLTLPLHSRRLQFGFQHDQDDQDDADVSVGNVTVLATILGPPALPQGATNAAAMMCQCFRDEFLCSMSCWCLKPKACEFPCFF